MPRIQVQHEGPQPESISEDGRRPCRGGPYRVIWDCQEDTVLARHRFEHGAEANTAPLIPERTLYAALAALPEAYEDVLAGKLFPYAFTRETFSPVAVSLDVVLSSDLERRDVFVCSFDIVAGEPGEPEVGSVRLEREDGVGGRYPELRLPLDCRAEPEEVRSRVRHEFGHVAFRALLPDAFHGQGGSFRFWDFFCVAFQDPDRSDFEPRHDDLVPFVHYDDQTAEGRTGRRTQRALAKRLAGRSPEDAAILAQARASMLCRRYSPLWEQAHALKRAGHWGPDQARSFTKRYWTAVGERGPGDSVVRWLNADRHATTPTTSNVASLRDELQRASVAAGVLRRHDGQWPALGGADLKRALEANAWVDDGRGTGLPKLTVRGCFLLPGGLSSDAYRPGYPPWVLARVLRVGGLQVSDNPWNAEVQRVTADGADSDLDRTLLRVLRHDPDATVACTWARLLLAFLPGHSQVLDSLPEIDEAERPRFVFVDLASGEGRWSAEEEAWSNAYGAVGSLLEDDLLPEVLPVDSVEEIRAPSFWEGIRGPVTVVLGGRALYEQEADGLRLLYDALSTVCELATERWIEHVLLPHVPSSGSEGLRFPDDEHVLRGGLRDLCPRDPGFGFSGWRAEPFHDEQAADQLVGGRDAWKQAEPDHIHPRLLAAVRLHREQLL